MSTLIGTGMPCAITNPLVTRWKLNAGRWSLAADRCKQYTVAIMVSIEEKMSKAASQQDCSIGPIGIDTAAIRQRVRTERIVVK